METGTGGVAGSSTVATAPDASATGGGGGTPDTAGPGTSRTGGRSGVGGAGATLGPDGTGGRFGTGGAGGILGTGGAAPLDAPRFDSLLAPADARDGAGEETSGVCSEVPCLAPLFVPCRPVGACTSDDVPTSSNGEQTITYCYPNGVKQQVSAISTATTMTAVLTEKLGSRVCFTIEGHVTLSGGTVSYIFRDGDGQQVATGTGRTTPESEEVMITCAGATPVQLSQSCMDATSPGSACNTGSCTF
jgi:hypothetical protein